VGRSAASRLEAGAAATILAVSYHHIWFSQNARAYTALLVCVLLSTHALVRWLDTRRGSLLAWYAAVTAVGAYAHLTMVLVSLSHALACGIERFSSPVSPATSVNGGPLRSCSSCRSRSRSCCLSSSAGRSFHGSRSSPSDSPCWRPCGGRPSSARRSPPDQPAACRRGGRRRSPSRS
jgi:hypothetical protein